MRWGGVVGRGVRSVLALTVLLAAGCSECASPDVEAEVAQWRSNLSAGLPQGSTVEAANGFFATHGLKPAYSSARRGMAFRIPVLPIDSRSYCNVVSSTVVIDCSFDVDERLQSCTVLAEHTGP